MRILLCALLLGSMLVASGCGGVMAMGPVVGLITIDEKGPVAVGDPSAAATLVGKAKAEGIILVAFGDASISAAAADAGITRIHHVDNETMNILGLYARYETIVYGE